MKTFLVINPQSANGQTGRRWPEIAAELGRGIGSFGHAFTERPEQAEEITKRALHEGYECVVAVGGDGTLNEVVNGFFEGGAAINPRAAIGIIGRGTGGDFQRTFGWNGSMRDVVERFGRDSTAPLDVGQVRFIDHQGKQRVRYFANICSFGASGQVTSEVNRGSKALGGKLSFMIGSVKALAKYSDRTVRLRFDGGEVEELKVTTVAVANGRYFGGGMLVSPGADTADGWFDVTIWSGYGLKDFALKAKTLYDGTHVKLKGTRTLRCQVLSADSDQNVLLDVDGEQPGRLPCEIRLLPAAIRLKV